MSVGQCGACGKPMATILPVCPHCGARRSTDAGATSPAGADAALPTPPITSTAAASKPDPSTSDPAAAAEWSAPGPPVWSLTPVHGLVALGIVLVLGILWYGVSSRRTASTPVAPGVVARAPEAGRAPASSPPAAVAPAATGPAAPPPDVTKFETADRAGKALEQAITAGVSYKDFEGRVEAFANELMVAKDRVATPPEQALFDSYTEVLTTYQDSRALWKEQSAQALKYGWATAPERNPEHLIVVEDDVVPIVQRYGLPTRQGTEGTVIAGSSIQFLWVKAATQFARARVAAGMR